MSKINIIEIRVRELLEQVESLRENDNELYVTYIEKYHFVEFNRETFINYKAYGLPSFKSIERARRKLQNEYGICEASEDVIKERREAERQYEEYAIDKHIPHID